MKRVKEVCVGLMVFIIFSGELLGKVNYGFSNTENPGNNTKDFYLASGFDSLNVQFVGNWPFGSSYVVEIDGSRNLSFLGSGGGVYILDISDPSNPQKISEKIHTKGRVYDIFYDSLTQNLFIACDKGGLEIWNVSDPLNPSKVGKYNSPGTTFIIRVYVQGSYAYVTADGGTDLNLKGLYIVDISDPASPSEVGFYNIMAGPRGVFVQDSLAYVIGVYTDGLHIINVSDPANPVEMGYYSTGAEFSWEVTGMDSLIFVSTAAGINILDVSDPTNPVELGSYTNWASGRMDVSGSYLYVVSYDTLSILDISDPTNPVRVGYYGNVDYPQDVSISGIHAYVAKGYETDAGVYVLDISNPASPAKIGFFGVPRLGAKVFVSGSYLYFTEGDLNFYGALRILDISDPSEPFEVGKYELPASPWGLFVSDSYAYVATPLAGLRIIDISDPSNPVEVGADSNYANDVYVSGNYAYTAGGGAGLRIFDISDPSNPVEVAVCTTIVSAQGVFVKDRYAYIADGFASGLCIIDVSDPSNPSMVGYYPIGDGKEVSVIGSYAYVTAGGAGFHVIDVSDPTSPFEVWSYDLPTWAWGIHIQDSFAYVAYSNKGVRVFDISNPSNPVEVGFYDVPTYALGVFAVNPYIYVADEYSGAQIYRNLLVSVEEKEVQKEPSVKIISDSKNLSFYLSYTGRINLSIFDISGRQKYNFSGVITNSHHTVSLRKFKTGVYFYKLKTKKTELSRKFLIIK